GFTILAADEAGLGLAERGRDETERLRAGAHAVDAGFDELDRKLEALESLQRRLSRGQPDRRGEQQARAALRFWIERRHGVDRGVEIEHRQERGARSGGE